MPTTITPDAFTNIGHDTWHSLRDARTLPFSNITKKLNGYWAPAAVFNTRVGVVGANAIRGRRVYGNLVTGGTDQSGQINAAVAANMVPIVSYKLGGISFTSGATGGADSVASDTAAFLASLNTLVYCCIWHEPFDDMTGPQYVALQERLVPIFNSASSNIKMGTFNHGWLLDTPSNITAFNSYLSIPLMTSGYGFVGIDSYQTGTQASPGSILPGDRMAPWQTAMNNLGFPNIPLGIGEWNGWTLAGIQSSSAFLANKNLAFECIWDSTSGVGLELSGTRLAAYQAFKADARFIQ